MPAAVCTNCGSSLTEQAAYCWHCGQSVKTINRAWYQIAREMLVDLFDVDGRMLTSLRMLLTRPGLLSREYISGRRTAYTSPVRLYLVISLAFFFVLSLQPEGNVSASADGIPLDAYSQAMFLLLPLFALLLKVFYRKPYYLAHLVFTVYLFSAIFIILAVMLPIESAADRYTAVAVVQFILLISMLVYCAMALRTTYPDSWSKTIFKLTGLLILFMPMLGGAIALANFLDGRIGA